MHINELALFLKMPNHMYLINKDTIYTHKQRLFSNWIHLKHKDLHKDLTPQFASSSSVFELARLQADKSISTQPPIPAPTCITDGNRLGGSASLVGGQTRIVPSIHRGSSSDSESARLRDAHSETTVREILTTDVNIITNWLLIIEN